MQGRTIEIPNGTSLCRELGYLTVGEFGLPCVLMALKPPQKARTWLARVRRYQLHGVVLRD